MSPTECLGPSDLLRISLQFEVVVALRAAESEHLGIVSDECNAMTGVYVSPAEVALLKTHPKVESLADRTRKKEKMSEERLKLS